MDKKATGKKSLLFCCFAFTQNAEVWISYSVINVHICFLNTVTALRIQSEISLQHGHLFGVRPVYQVGCFIEVNK